MGVVSGALIGAGAAGQLGGIIFLLILIAILIATDREFGEWVGYRKRR